MINKQKLQELHDYIKNNVKSDKFSMRQFVSGVARPSDLKEALHDCGTAACLAGYSPLVHPPSNIGQIPIIYFYLQHIEEVYGVRSKSIEWYYLFSDKWVMIDDSLEYNLKRLQDYIDNGLPHNLLVLDYSMGEQGEEAEDIFDKYLDMYFREI